jgi:cell division initiation protein
MFTPQQIEEQTFVKAVFGGYDMQSVDDFLGPLTEDYVVLYKENAVLKSKMKVLVEKLEEYRSQEDSMKKALLAAQQTADNMIAATQKKCARMLNDAQKTLEGQHTDLKNQIQGEQARLQAARGAVQEYITQLQVELEDMKTRQMVAAEPVAKAYDFDAEPENRPVDMAKTIEQNLEKLVGEEIAKPGDRVETPAPAEQPAEAPAETVVSQETKVVRPKGVSQDTLSKFADLQFGKNYDPNGE